MKVARREQVDSRFTKGSGSRVLAMLVCVLMLPVLSACGGGGGGGGGQPSSPSNPPPPPPPPPPNEAPVVSAGDDQTIQLPTTTVEVTGSAEDDPDDELTYTWTAEPDAGVTFADASAASTTVTFTDAGAYVLTLTVSDGELSGNDSLQVTVTEAPNDAPVVAAGEDQTIELPENSVALAGTATDDSEDLTYTWTADPVDGVTFDDAAAAVTTARFSAAGTYTLTLSVSDGTNTGTDTLAVVVNPAVYPAADTDADELHGWAEIRLADAGMDGTLLAAAREYALQGGGSGMIVRRGRLVYSWGDIDARADVKSTTKSLGGIALGLAIDDLLLTLSDTAQTHLPSIGDPPVENVATGWLDDITVLQLATHTAGFAKPGGYEPLLYEPGTTWAYSDAGLNWLADLLTALYQQDLSTVLTDRVWSVLGINTDDLRWRDNSLRPDPRPSGIPHRELASGISVNVNAMARVGLLFLRNGVWANDQRILSQEAIDMFRTPRPEIAGATIANQTAFPGATENYGVLWWTNTTQMLPNVPADAYWAWGLGDSLIVVIPSLDLVIARTGNHPDTPGLPRWRNDWNGDYTVLDPFLTPIVQAVTE